MSGEKGKWSSGSLTVEASILIPFLLLIIFVFLCLGLYWHDRSVLSACASELAGKGAARKYETEAHLKAWLEGQAGGLAEERLLLLQSVEASAEVTGKKITVTYTGSTPLLGGLKVCEQETAKRLNPVTFIRRSMQLEEFVSGASG